jgi:glycosyltransferase involved in cell wall biosynthesis
MDRLPHISVVVPTRNRAHYLKDCLDSLAHQSYPHDRLELVVIDDGSVDDTKGVVEAFQRETSVRSSYHRQSHSGLNVSRNRGVRAATGAAIAFIDDDELAPHDLFRTLAAALLENPAASAAGGAYRSKFEGEAKGLVCPSCRAVFKDSLAAEGTSLWVNNLPGGCLLVWRDTFDKYGMFHESLSGPGDDTEWCARVCRSGGKLLLADGAWVWHRVGAGELRFAAFSRKGFSGMRNLAQARRLMFWPGSWLADVGQAMRFFAHGLWRRCSFGIAQGLTSLVLAFHWRLVVKRNGMSRCELESLRRTRSKAER